MGRVVPAFKRSIDLLRMDPRLLLVAGGVLLVSFLLANVLSLIPLLGPILQLGHAYLVRPLVLAAVLALIVGVGKRGHIELDDLVEGPSDHGLSLAGAFAVIITGAIIGAVALTVVLVFVAGFGSALQPGSGVADALGVVGLALVGLALLVGIVIGLVVQFVDVAIVVGGAGALESFRTAAATVRAAPLSVVGYSLVRTLLTLLPTAGVFGVLVVFGVAAGAAGAEGDAAGLVVIVGSVLAALVLVPILRTLSLVFHVTFFASLTREFDL